MGFCKRLERGQFSLTIVFLFSHFDEFLCKGDTMLDWGPDPEPEQGEHPYDPNNPDLVAPAMGTTTVHTFLMDTNCRHPFLVDANCRHTFFMDNFRNISSAGDMLVINF